MTSSKSNLVSQIRRYNQGVAEDFLKDFDEAALADYLRRVRDLAGHRGPASRWVREGSNCAVVAR